MQQTIVERNIFIESRNQITKRKALNECEGIINICGRLINFKRISPVLFRFSCLIMPGRMILFTRSLEKNFILSKSDLELNQHVNSDEPYLIKILLTLPIKIQENKIGNF